MRKVKTLKWFRFYAEVLHDPKVQRLNPQTFKHWVNLLCLAAANDGVIEGDRASIAFSLRVSENMAGAIIAGLVAEGLIERVETGLQPHNWHARQFVSDVSTNRVKKFREQKRNADETFQKPPQIQIQIQNREEPPMPPSETVALDEEFERAWQRWPAKGRTRRLLCETNWTEVFLTVREEDYGEMIAAIHEGIDRWLASDLFAKGFVHGFADFLAQRRWSEEPEPAARSIPAEPIMRNAADVLRELRALSNGEGD